MIARTMLRDTKLEEYLGAPRAYFARVAILGGARTEDDIDDAIADALERSLQCEFVSHIHRRNTLAKMVAQRTIDAAQKRHVREVAVVHLRNAMLQHARIPMEAMLAKEIRAAIDTARMQLTPREREAFDGKYLRGLSYDRIAEDLGCTDRAASILVARACARMRAYLRASDFVPEGTPYTNHKNIYEYEIARKQHTRNRRRLPLV